MPSSKIPEVGVEVEALCTKCKNATMHVITTVKEGEISRVKCKKCLDSHRYRPIDEKIKKKLAKLKKMKKAKKPSQSRETRKWNKLLEQADPENAISYRMGATYTEHDVIQHDKFGLGVVVKILEPGKISVVFSDGVKNMVQNMKSR
ncbi:hypothetical protein JXO59_13060 [candidate division KSB1 bacterium]|nr:hypothetical protein [candidate division KSB1 bacterium]